MPTRVCSGALGLQPTHRLDQLQPRPDCPLRIILVCLRVAEVHEHTVAHVLRDEPAEAPHNASNTLLVGRNDLAQVLRIHTCRECGRTDEVREHYGDLAALCGVLWGGGRCSRSGSLRDIFLAAREFGYRSEELTPMTERQPDLFKVLIGEIGQDGKADIVLGKALRVLPEAELIKPVRNLLHHAARVVGALPAPLASLPDESAMQ
jgi:hypothetical protein